MAPSKKAPFHERLYMMALFWLLICFEPLSKYQFILTCLPEAPFSHAVMSLEGRSLRTAKVTVLVLSEGNIEDFGEGLVCFGEETSETLTQTESAAQMRYRMYLKRKEDSRRIAADLYRLYNSSVENSYEDAVLFKNLSLWKRPMVVEMPAAYFEKEILLGSPTCCERATESTKDEKKKQTQQQGKGKKPQQQQKQQQQQQQQQQETRQEYQQEQQQRQQQQQQQQQQKQQQQQQQQQQKRKFPGCACQCRPSDTIRSGRLRPRRCTLQLKNFLLVMWAPSKLNVTSSTSRPKPDLTQQAFTQSQGRRIRKVQSRPWNVDATPNHKGQAQRNAVKFQNESIDLHDLQGSGGGHRGVVDLLLMSTLQRHAPTESGWRVEMLRFFLVCLACLGIIQSRMEDQKGRRVTKKGRTRRLLSLDFLLRLGKRLWTARNDTESNKLLRDNVSNPVTDTANEISSGVERHSGDTTAVDGVTTHVDGVIHSFFGAERCCSAAGASDREAAEVLSSKKSSYSRPTEMDNHNSADMQPPFVNDLMIRDVLQFLTEGGVFQTEDVDIIEADLKADEDVDPQTRSVWNALFNCDHHNNADDDAHPHTGSVLKDALFNVGHETKHAGLIEEILNPAFCHNKAAYQQNNANPGVCHNDAANHPNSAYTDYDKAAAYQSNNVYQVYPATGFLPTLGGGDGTRGYLDHVGYRLASLAALPTWCKMSRVRLSEAGFHYDPRANPGAVVCHRCGAAYSLGSSGEEGSATTPPLVFHQQASPDCPFMARILEPLTHMPPTTGPASQVSTSAGSAPAQMSEMMSSSAGTTTGAMGLVSADSAPSVSAPEQSNNARDLSEDCDAMRPTSSGYTLALPGSSADQRPPPSNRDGAGRDSEVDRPSLDLSSAVYPQFSTATSRLTTFRTWPQELMETFPPQALVALGFYFAGYADCIRCFFCGVGLKAWDPADDALTEHVRWRPQCGFLLATKGRQHIQNIVDRINARAGNRNSQSGQPSTTSQTAPQSNTGSSGAATSAGNSRQISAASDGSGQASQNNPGSTTGRQGMQSDGSGSRRTQEDHLTQQLRTMGFSSDDIARTRQRLQNSGQPCDLDNFLASLLEGL